MIPDKNIFNNLYVWHPMTDQLWYYVSVSGGNRKVKYGNFFRKRRTEEPNNVINFLVNY